MNKRTDRARALQVDLAVNIAAVYGAAAGVMSLLGQGIPASVLQRVLMDVGPRRGAPREAAPSSPQPDHTGSPPQQ